MIPRGFVDRMVPLPRACFRERLPSRVVRVVWRALAADASEHGGYIICSGVDFRSKTAERQYTNIALIKEIFPIVAIFENILIDIEGFLLHLYFCVRLRFSIRH
ncbi:hypothetical protein P0D75_31555 [Paraburkholderia sediminicola]|uniref:hypothetical protein n=1 Tax=Paraburkholderia sediminicola TaxID=458836 RepID=UPI0038B8EB3B